MRQPVACSWKCNSPPSQRTCRFGTGLNPGKFPSGSSSIPTTMLRYGLSPRGRGNHNGADQRAELHRSIPAWAGEPPLVLGYYDLAQVYPRVGGGTLRFRWLGSRWVYPRVGGGTSLILPMARSGLSPRGRGNRNGDTYSESLGGSIPAWAGEPLLS